MKKRFTIRARKENESQTEYKNYIQELIQENMPLDSNYEGEYMKNVSKIATILHNQIFVQNLVGEIRPRSKGESHVDYMDYLMNIVKDAVPFSSGNSITDEEKQKVYAEYMESVYKVALDLYNRLEKKEEVSEKKKTSKKSVKNSKKKKATRKKKGPFTKIMDCLKSIFQKEEDSKTSKKKVSKKKTKQHVQTKSTSNKQISSPNLDGSLDEEMDDLLEIDQLLEDTADLTTAGYEDNIVIPELAEENLEIRVPELNVRELPSGELVQYQKRENSIYDQKQDFNDIVENYVQNCMIPGPITDDMNMADILDVMYPVSHEPLKYEEIQEYVEFWKWELSMKEEHEKHAKVLTK